LRFLLTSPICIVILACEQRPVRSASSGPATLTPHLQFGLKASHAFCSNQSALVCCPYPSVDACRTSDIRKIVRRSIAFSFARPVLARLNHHALTGQLIMKQCTDFSPLLPENRNKCNSQRRRHSAYGGERGAGEERSTEQSARNRSEVSVTVNFQYSEGD
jgi:hypothetical protein